MTVEQLRAYVVAGSVLVQAGVATISQVKAMIALLHPGMSEEEENAIVTALRDDSGRRVIMARLDEQQAIDDAAKS